MWIAFAVGWVLGSVTLYIYLIGTAREPANSECMDCTLPGCEECPYRTQAGVSEEVVRKAA